MANLVYLDNQSTTRCDPRVLERMLPYFSEEYGNAASKTHRFGWMAEAAVDLAREQVAASLGANASEIVFCSGATEANNLAIRGAAHAYAARGKHLVVAATEHASVLDCVHSLEREGWEVTVLGVSADGSVEPETLREALRETTTVVSLMLVNNETGVISDIAALASIVHECAPKAFVHCDAVQALGKIPIDVGALGVDLLTVSAHKVYGPKGVGALWRRRRPRLVLTPQIVGGGHEAGLRSGTLPVPLIVGFGGACELAEASRGEEGTRIAALRDELLTGIGKVGGIEVNGSMADRIASNLNVAIEGVNADVLIGAVPDVAFSTGSACSSASSKASHVLAAMVSPERARRSIRLGIGRFTTRDEISIATEALCAAITKVRSA